MGYTMEGRGLHSACSRLEVSRSRINFAHPPAVPKNFESHSAIIQVRWL